MNFTRIMPMVMFIFISAVGMHVKDVCTLNINPAELQFNPKGSLLAVAEPLSLREPISGGDISIWEINNNSARLRRTLQNENECRTIQWAPDGKYLCTFDFGYRARKWDVASGTIVREFIYDFDFEHVGVWAPDGQRFAYSYFDEQENTEVLKIQDVTGIQSEPYIIARGPRLYPAAWSQNGKKLAFLAGVHDAIHVMDFNRGLQEEHTDNSLGSPTFQPDSHKLTFIPTNYTDNQPQDLLVPPSAQLRRVTWNHKGTLLAQTGFSSYQATQRGEPDGGVLIRKFNGNSFQENALRVTDADVFTAAWGANNTFAFGQNSTTRIVRIVAAARARSGDNQ